MKIKSVKFNQDSFRMEVVTPFKVKFEGKEYTGEIASYRNSFQWNTDQERINFFGVDVILDTFLLDEISIGNDNTLVSKYL